MIRWELIPFDVVNLTGNVECHELVYTELVGFRQQLTGWCIVSTIGIELEAEYCLSRTLSMIEFSQSSRIYYVFY